MLRTGISYREPLTVWVDGRPPGIDYLEILAEVFVRPEMANLLAMLTGVYPLAIRSMTLSLGTPGPLREDLLKPVVDIAKATNPLWVSEPIGFSRTPEIDLHRCCPVPPTDDSIAIIADHAGEVSDRCGCPVLLETIASPLRLNGPLPEPDFLNRLCEKSGCNLLLDITALYVNSRNHSFDAGTWLARIDPAHIAQLHVAGYNKSGRRWVDRHDSAIQPEIWALARTAAGHSPEAGRIIEHDIDIPSVEIVEEELASLRQIGAPA